MQVVKERFSFIYWLRSWHTYCKILFELHLPVKNKISIEHHVIIVIFVQKVPCGILSSKSKTFFLLSLQALRGV